jgi:hypothetical protein
MFAAALMLGAAFTQATLCIDAEGRSLEADRQSAVERSCRVMGTRKRASEPAGTNR